MMHIFMQDSSPTSSAIPFFVDEHDKSKVEADNEEVPSSHFSSATMTSCSMMITSPSHPHAFVAANDHVHQQQCDDDQHLQQQNKYSKRGHKINNKPDPPLVSKEKDDKGASFIPRTKNKKVLVVVVLISFVDCC
jgi:hypothetical protein